MNRCRIDRDRRTLTVVANDAFTSQPFTPASVRAIYDALRDRLPAPYKKYRIARGQPQRQSHRGAHPQPAARPRRRRGTPVGPRALRGQRLGHQHVAPLRARPGPRGLPPGLVGQPWPILQRRGVGMATPVPVRHDGGPLHADHRRPLSHSHARKTPAPSSSRPANATGRRREAVVRQRHPQRRGHLPGDRARRRGMAAHAALRLRPRPLRLARRREPLHAGKRRDKSAPHGARDRLATATWTPRLPRCGRYAVYVSYTTLPCERERRPLRRLPPRRTDALPRQTNAWAAARGSTSARSTSARAKAGRTASS